MLASIFFCAIIASILLLRFMSYPKKYNEKINLNVLLYIYVAIGLCLLLSASEGNYFMVVKQFVHVILASIVLFTVQRVSCEHLQKIAVSLYIVTIILLLLVLTIGHTGKGAQRWLDLKFIRFEPSEIMKIVLPLTLASFIQKQELPMSKQAILARFCS